MTSISKTLQFQHRNVRVNNWQPMSNSWSTSSEPDFVRTLGQRETARNRQGKILYAELVNGCYLWPEGRNPRVGTPSGGIRENGAS